MKRTAKELAEAIGARLEGDGAMEIAGVAAPERAGARDLIYVEAAKHAERVAASAAMCIVAGEGLSLQGKTVLRSAQPKVAFAKAAALPFPCSCRWLDGRHLGGSVAAPPFVEGLTCWRSFCRRPEEMVSANTRRRELPYLWGGLP